MNALLPYSTRSMGCNECIVSLQHKQQGLQWMHCYPTAQEVWGATNALLACSTSSRACNECIVNLQHKQQGLQWMHCYPTEQEVWAELTWDNWSSSVLQEWSIFACFACFRYGSLIASAWVWHRTSLYAEVSMFSPPSDQVNIRPSHFISLAQWQLISDKPY